MKNINKILFEELQLIRLDEARFKEIRYIALVFVRELDSKLKQKKIDAQVFIGGSLAKGTLAKKSVQDVDIFVRFNKKYNSDKISSLLEGVDIKGVKKIHGSRDYYQKVIEGVVFEIVPVMKINTPKEATNITDLSYFHVNYIIKKFKSNKKLADDILIAKTFAYACNCYGAESYINGFSGYAIELLVVHYGSFINFAKAIVKMNENQQIIIDDAGFYKDKKSVLNELNKSKINSPIILIDPTFKERNALAGLSKESFLNFKKYCSGFLKNPSGKFFIKYSIETEFEKYKDVKIIKIVTNKQAGDIAGTKSKKFFRYFLNNLHEEFEVKKSGFEYDNKNNNAKFYFVVDKKKDENKKGPPINNKKSYDKFKKVHKKVFVKGKYAYIKVKHNFSFESWFKLFVKKEKRVIKDMSVKSVRNG